MAPSALSVVQASGPGWRRPAAWIPQLKSGTAVLAIAASQVVVSLCLLAIYEGYKTYFYNTWLSLSVQDKQTADGNSQLPEPPDMESSLAIDPVVMYQEPLDWRSPMGASFYVAIANSVFAVFGLAGIFNKQRELILCFFAYNTAQMVIAFHFFVDLMTDTRIDFNGMPGQLTEFERATTAFIFFAFLLSCAATVFAMRSIEEVKAKQREENNRFMVLSNTLNFEADV
mmetsp:Transcript_9607/g.29127  ORF Transcript_9607/g.29127 Transcript_9607/m.29127 type:complete len:228 (-) Transcript_9607:67-750(-)